MIKGEAEGAAIVAMIAHGKDSSDKFNDFQNREQGIFVPTQIEDF